MPDIGLFDVLVGLFILWSFIAPVFSKKKKRREAEEARRRHEAEGERASAETAKQGDNAQSIWKEIESIFGEPHKADPTQAPPGDVYQKFPELDEEDEREAAMHGAPTLDGNYRERGVSVEPERESWIDLKEREMEESADFFDRQQDIMRRAERIDIAKLESPLPVATAHRDRANPLASSIKQKLSNPETFREAFVISEILQTPGFSKKWR
jgi:hypothetical protein